MTARDFKLNYILCIFFFIFSEHGFGQKHIERIVPWDQLKWIRIDADSVFKVHVKSVQTDYITLNIDSEGEHSEQVALKYAINQGSLDVSVGLNPVFARVDDKLNAHKALSIELFVLMPNSKQIQITSDIATVSLIGIYRNALVELINGSCFLDQYSGNATVNTIKGDIEVSVKEDSEVKAQSKHGTLNIQSSSKANHFLSLNSINGDITVRNSQ